jgi:hypothetical protein
MNRPTKYPKNSSNNPESYKIFDNGGKNIELFTTKNIKPMETDKLSRNDLRMIKESLTFFIREMVINPDNQKPPSERDQFKLVFLKIARMLKSENEPFKTIRP